MKSRFYSLARDVLIRYYKISVGIMKNIAAFIAILSVFSFFFFSSSLVSATFAQTEQSNCVITQIGNPPKTQNQQLPAGCGGTGVSGTCGSVVDWDNKIVENLIPGVQGLYNNLTTQIKSNCASSTPPPWFENMYWCTYSVVDAYNIAGLKGMTTADDGGVVSMHKFFMQQQNGFVYVEYEKSTNHLAALQKVKPGYAMMLEAQYLVASGEEHVILVKSITIDSHGNGKIVVDQSNSGTPNGTFPIVNGEVITGWIPVAAFGGHS